MQIKLIKGYRSNKKIIKRIYEKGEILEMPTSKNKIFTSITEKILTKKLYKKDIQNVILSEVLKNSKSLIIELNDKNINILDGRKLFKYLIIDIIEHILINKQKSTQETVVSILTNSSDEIILKDIIEISKKVKRLNIISNHLEKFRKTEDYLYNELGIMITCSNNKKSSLAKSDIIINFDFVEEEINKFKIPIEAIIINILDKVSIKTKRFNGINISYFNIEIPDKYKIDGFSNEEIYEGVISEIKTYEQIKSKIDEDKIRINYLIGNNGQIDNKEFMQNIHVNY